jgi:hypothetical protein
MLERITHGFENQIELCKSDDRCSPDLDAWRCRGTRATRRRVVARHGHRCHRPGIARCVAGRPAYRDRAGAQRHRRPEGELPAARSAARRVPNHRGLSRLPHRGEIRAPTDGRWNRRIDEHQPEQHRGAGDRPEPGIGRRSAGADAQFRVGVRARQRSVINIRSKSGSNDFKGAAWEYFRDDALNARNYFSSITPPQNFNQFGANAGGPLWRNKTFFFASYEGTRNDISRPYAFQVETPEFRDYVFRTVPGCCSSFPRRRPSPASTAIAIWISPI